MNNETLRHVVAWALGFSLAMLNFVEAVGEAVSFSHDMQIVAGNMLFYCLLLLFVVLAGETDSIDTPAMLKRLFEVETAMVVPVMAAYVSVSSNNNSGSVWLFQDCVSDLLSSGLLIALLVIVAMLIGPWFNKNT